MSRRHYTGHVIVSEPQFTMSFPGCYAIEVSAWMREQVRTNAPSALVEPTLTLLDEWTGDTDLLIETPGATFAIEQEDR